MGILFSGIYAQELIVPPKQQLKAGVAIHDIKCKAEFELVFKATDGSPACVKPTSVEKLIERGWAIDQSLPESSEDGVTVGDSDTSRDSVLTEFPMMSMMSGETYYAIFAAGISDIRDSVDTRLGSDALVGSFRINSLLKFPNNEIILLAFSNQTTQTAIIDAKANGFGYVGYDNEKANGALSTPQEELDDPALFTNYLGVLVKNAGLKYVVAPTRPLLQQEYLGVDWNNVDLLVMQLQGSRSITEYVEIGSRVGKHVNSQNPNTIILAQINPTHPKQMNGIAGIQDELTQLRDVIDGVSIICGQCTDAQFNELIDAVNIALG